MDSAGCLVTVWLVVVAVLVPVLVSVRECNSDRHYREWRECRTLITTNDSATVLKVRPECRKWTWPQPEASYAR